MFGSRSKKTVNTIIALIGLYFITSFSQAFEPDLYSEFRNMQLQLLIMSVIAYMSCQRYYFIIKSILLVNLFNSTAIYISDYLFNGVCWQLSLVEMIVLLFILSYQFYKCYDIKSDRPSQNTLCILFYKPSSMFQFISSLFGAPVCSCSVLIGNKRYGLAYGYDTIQERSWNETVINNNIVIDTGISVSKFYDVIPELMKQRARVPNKLWIRLNCVGSLKPVLERLPNYLNPDSIVLPSIYLNKIINCSKY